MNGEAILIFLGLGSFLLLDIVIVLVILSRSDRDRRTRIRTAEERLAEELPAAESRRRRPLISQLVSGEYDGSAPWESQEAPAERRSRRRARDPVSPYVKAVGFATLAFISLFGILFALSYSGVAAPLLVVGFFVLLFGLESFTLRRLAYFGIGAALFLGVVFLAPPEVIWGLFPILAIGGFFAVLGLILWQKQTEKSPSEWRKWGKKHRARAVKGEKTARILGRVDPSFGTRSRPSSIERSRQVRAKRMMYPVP
ncbi:MAG: hypothetical protein ACYS47_03660 [Planctomycetota bacterium]|jgi:hypothetical protein